MDPWRNHQVAWRTLDKNRSIATTTPIQLSYERCACADSDVDRLKSVNDASGLRGGGGVLIEVADRIRKSIRAGDGASRLTGDDLAAPISPAGSRTRTHRIVGQFQTATPYLITSRGWQIWCSVPVGANFAGRDTDTRARLAATRGRADVRREVGSHNACELARSRRATTPKVGMYGGSKSHGPND